MTDNNNSGRFTGLSRIERSMVKMLLSAVLVATQVLSWNASPLYLCLSADGSICLDFGPDNCAGCRHEPAESECASRHDACHEHDHGQLDDSASHESGPCGCDHVQISEPQAATLARAVAAPDSPHQAVPPAALLSHRTSGCCFSATGGLPHVPLTGHDAPPATLVLLASVVIQC